MDWTLVIGLSVGMVSLDAQLARDRSGLLSTTAAGMVGALLANHLGQALLWYRPGGFAGCIAALAGALVLITMHRSIVMKP